MPRRVPARTTKARGAPPLLLLAVGRIRGDPAAALYDHYAGRLTRWRLALREIEIKGGLPPERRRAAEGAAMLAALPDGAALIALDERGEAATSGDFARRLEAFRDAGRPVVFAVGGPDGLDAKVAARADWSLALGRLTWPHLLARALLAEQLYRAQQIAAGHPYHRG